MKQKKVKKSMDKSDIFLRVREILESARTHVARSVNTTQVIANWLIGREIVEEEQNNNVRAEYGRKLLQTLSDKLQQIYGVGYSVDNLEYFRRFYQEYSNLISDALPRKLDALKSPMSYAVNDLFLNKKI